MSEIIEISEQEPLNFNQRWNSYLAIALAGVMLFLGLTLRNATLNATQTFEDLEAGIRAQVPAGWLLDNESDEYVLRAIDPDALPYKTQFQVAIMTVRPDATPNLVLDLLSKQRAGRFATYVEIERIDDTLRDDPAKRMTYAFTDFERNPFQQSLPVSVEAVDVVVLQRGQAVIITYREEQNAFEDNLYRFEQFLQSVEIF